MSSFVKPQKSVGWRRYSPLVAALSAGCVCLVAGWFFFHEEPETEAPERSVEFPALDCRFYLPGEPWHKSEPKITNALQAQLVYERPRPRIWLALLVQDYGKRTPSNAEVRDELIRRLHGYFNPDNLEWEERPDVPLAGLPAQCIAIQGEVDGMAMRGECSMLFAKGRAYCLALWSPLARINPKLYKELRGQLAFLDQGERVRPPPATDRLLQLPGTTVSLLVNDPDWQEWLPATDYDPQAVLALVIRPAKRPSKDKGPPPAVAVSAIFLILHPGEENIEKASRRAIDLLEKQQKADYPDTKLERTGDDPLDRMRAPFIKMISIKVRNGENRVRFFLLGLLPGKSHVIVAQCECAWEEKRQWEEPMKLLLSGIMTEETKRAEPPDQGPGGVPGD
jgi:hypothetical protein